jgi:hypothetical protein
VRWDPRGANRAQDNLGNHGESAKASRGT